MRRIIPILVLSTSLGAAQDAPPPMGPDASPPENYPQPNPYPQDQVPPMPQNLPPGGFPQAGPNAAPPDQPGPGQEEGQEPAPAASTDMSREDAVVNFPTVVNSFISNRSPDGYWPLKDKATGQVMRLKLVKVNTGNLRKLGSNKYAGSALLAEAEKKTRLKVEFSVDFSGTEWKVTGMRILTKSEPPAVKPPPKPAPGAAGKAPEESSRKGR